MVKINIKKERLMDAVKKVSGVYNMMAKKDNAIVVLQAMTGKRGDEVYKGLTLSCFNGSSQVASSVFCESDSEIEGNVIITLGGEFISAVMALSAVSGDNFTIKDNGGSITVSVGDSDILVQKKSEGVMPVDFDVKDKACIEGQFIIDVNAFKNNASAVLFAALDEEKAIGGVGIVCSKENIVFRATDSKRLAESKATLKKAAFAKETDNLSVVVSPSVLKMVVSSVGNADIAFVKTTKHVVLQCGTDVWQIPAIDKTFPHNVFEGVRKMVRGNTVTINKAMMNVALGIVAAADSKDNIACLFCMENGKLVVYESNKTAKAVVEVKTEGDVPEIVSFDVKLLKSVVNAFKGDTLTFELADKAPNAIYANGESVFTALTPVKIAGEKKETAVEE